MLYHIGYTTCPYNAKSVKLRVNFSSKNELVLDGLRSAIIRGQIRPGERIVIDELAEQMGVSQIPIREALRQLEADGFVTFKPYVGATVTEISTGLITEVFAMLESMEIVCSRVACQQMTEAELNTMESMIREMDTSVNQPDKWSQDNKALHLFVADCANMTLVRKMMQKVLDHWDRVRLYYLQDVFAHRIKIAQEEHKQILEAFRSHDPDQVERIVREHNQAGLASYTHYVNTTEEK
jgi:DNA-binding GntR family transcriptional regulator